MIIVGFACQSTAHTHKRITRVLTRSMPPWAVFVYFLIEQFSAWITYNGVQRNVPNSMCDIFWQTRLLTLAYLSLFTFMLTRKI